MSVLFYTLLPGRGALPPRIFAVTAARARTWSGHLLSGTPECARADHCLGSFARLGAAQRAERAARRIYAAHRHQRRKLEAQLARLDQAHAAELAQILAPNILSSTTENRRAA